MKALEFFEQGHPFVGVLVGIYLAALGATVKASLELGDQEKLQDAAVIDCAHSMSGKSLVDVIDAIKTANPRFLMPVGRNWFLVVLSVVMLVSAFIVGFFKPLAKIFPDIDGYGDGAFTMFLLLFLWSSAVLWLEYRYTVVLGTMKTHIDRHRDVEIVVEVRRNDRVSPPEGSPLTSNSTRTRRKRRAG